MRGQRGRPDGPVDGEINEAFWAQAAANRAGPNGVDDSECQVHAVPHIAVSYFNTAAGVDGGAIPFATQFFHDDYDDGPGFDDVYDGGDGGAPVEAGEQDLLAATQGQTRRVKPETVNYAKRAKRVDVRKLKDNIWKGLDIVAPAIEDGEDVMVSPSITVVRNVS